MIIIIIFLIIILTEILYSPRLDYTKDEDLLLWYNGKPKRKYIVIFKTN